MYFVWYMVSGQQRAFGGRVEEWFMFLDDDKVKCNRTLKDLSSSFSDSWDDNILKDKLLKEL